MTVYIKYNLETMEDIKVGTTVSQFDNEYALSYISGSAIRGAFIKAYINANNGIDICEDDKSRELLLNGRLRFLNAYIESRGQRCIPFPCCLYAKKDELKKFAYNNPINIKDEFNNKIGSGMEKVKVSDFCVLDDNNVEVKNVNKIFNLHITKKENIKNNDKSSIYRYEAIKKGQTFSGIVCLDGTEDEAKGYAELMDNLEVNIGGSKDSGYGKCLIKNVKVLNYNPELESFMGVDEEDFDGYFYIYALSDIISRDYYGRIISYIDEKLLKDSLKLDQVNLLGSSIETNISCGYNSKWNCRLPETSVIKAGSIFKYSFKGVIKDENILRLQDAGIGTRREDGYGRIVILDEFNIKNVTYEQKEKMDINAPNNLNDEQKMMLEVILTRIYKNSIESSFDNKIISMDSMFTNKLSDSQIGKIIEIIQNVKESSAHIAKDEFNSYINDMKAKKNNPKAYYQFRDTKLGNKSFDEYLIEYFNKCDDVQEFINNFAQFIKDINISSIRPKLDSDYVYRKNLEFLEQFLKFEKGRGCEDEY